MSTTRLAFVAQCATVVLAGFLVVPRAQADAVLVSAHGAADAAASRVFPSAESAEIAVRAQVEATTITLQFPPLAQPDDYTLTVPGPKGAYVVGVEVSRGADFAPAKIAVGAPPPPAGGSDLEKPEMKAWLGLVPLVARLDKLDAGPLAVRVHFLRLLRRLDGVVSFDVGLRRCPLRPADSPGPSAALTVALRTFRPLTIFDVSGGTGTTVDRQETSASVASAVGALAAAEELHLTYAEKTEEIAVSFLAHRTPTADPLGGGDGYFLLTADADVVEASDTTPRSITLVIDRSGSMEGPKIAQAKQAALALLDTIRETDRVNVLSFNDQVGATACAPQPATPETLEAARAYVLALVADGSTNLAEATLQALGKSCAEAADTLASRLHVVILLSDGQPTAGVTDKAQILGLVAAGNRYESRVYAVSVGQGADVPLMEALARGARGRNFVLTEAQAQSELADTVKRLAEDIRAVRVLGLSLTVDGIETSEVLPEKTPDLYSGGQVLVVGRYAAPGKGAIRATGDANGSPYEWSADIEAGILEKSNAFIKYLWATEKVGALIADEARSGRSHRDEITKLGLGYTIQTPYTSFAYGGAGGASGGASGGAGGSSGGASGGGSTGADPAALEHASVGGGCSVAGPGSTLFTLLAAAAIGLALRPRLR